ncbi:protein-L-isoaspartate O-methyltransferase family protein [Bartonella quintana]|uniref:Protein-L-isoaspartate O-methyltransferase n=3 Tax=Bartonella quintana TaxID=803 RepID=A0A0H3LUH4_BARQU|nr:protein-L-isoaspartate O-methyltransferase [Bartonella quintana]ETS13242.1 protein-L-isoaspartate O-methyltransferase [Bartonella quintana BQ2-D70]ETS14101.1 protein-L-isoaspartate O-methyltransferase [Bartonella quintana JK 73rel]ETS15788.1 protein-L-isoaspartate O-methyltransferase [Bartonella quintana JK 73]ETS17791.1 protein-L-isoaspartate O-methyltransferase [Bartonella quintana JK 7]ETS18620.1 protein-L-isoaspartate O-methyltransferase [Bartonella quintana JK 12]
MVADFAELRRKMVDNQIRTVDVTDLSVLEAFLTVSREDFVPEDMKAFSYLDTDILVYPAKNQLPACYLMRPASLAKLLQLAAVKSSDIVLDIGTNSGYCAALLSKLAGFVIALEDNKVLLERATSTLKLNQCNNVVVVHGALEKGYAVEGPYDVIFIEGSVDFIPEGIFDQMKDGGRLVVVEGHGNAGVARIYVKEDGIISARRAFNLAVKRLPGFLKAPDFIF